MDPKTLLRQVYSKRDPESHKGDFGRILVIGGSSFYTGAPILAAMSAYRSGADLVTIAAPARAADVAASHSPNLMTFPLKGDFLSHSHIRHLQPLIDKADCVLIGNGLGQQAIPAARDIISILKCPTIIDADALKSLPKRLPKKSIMTPHRKEYEYLSGNAPFTSASFMSCAKKHSAVILLKGRVDMITDGTRLYTSSTGNPYMTVGGTGDVLAGICAALLARTSDPLKSAVLAAYICGAAGDLAAKRLGESMLATDVIDSIHTIISQTSRKAR